LEIGQAAILMPSPSCPVAVIISVGTSGLTLSSTITQVFQTRIHHAIVEGYDDWRNIAISLFDLEGGFSVIATIFPSKVGLPAAVALQSLASPIPPLQGNSQILSVAG